MGRGPSAKTAFLSAARRLAATVSFKLVYPYAPSDPRVRGMRTDDRLALLFAERVALRLGLFLGDRLALLFPDRLGLLFGKRIY
jgi:hypothetical protein